MPERKKRQNQQTLSLSYMGYKVTKHVVKDGKAVLSDAIYGHEYEFKGIKAPNSYQLADKSKAYKVEADEETDTIIYYFENARIVVPNTGV